MHGWPETWYAWRLLMPALARDFEVIASTNVAWGCPTSPRVGTTPVPSPTHLVALMDALGHERFAADHPDRVDRLVLAELPGSPGAAPSPPMFVPGPLNDRRWHMPFNRVDKLNEQLMIARR